MKILRSSESLGGLGEQSPQRGCAKRLRSLCSQRLYGEHRLFLRLERSARLNDRNGLNGLQY